MRGLCDGTLGLLRLHRQLWGWGWSGWRCCWRSSWWNCWGMLRMLWWMHRIHGRMLYVHVGMLYVLWPKFTGVLLLATSIDRPCGGVYTEDEVGWERGCSFSPVDATLWLTATQRWQYHQRYRHSVSWDVLRRYSYPLGYILKECAGFKLPVSSTIKITINFMIEIRVMHT